MDISKFKLGLGPMSKDIVDMCLEYSKVYDYPIMLIASRNQVDFDSGYAFTTKEFTEYVKKNKNYDPNRVLICRDHCGPYFSDSDKHLTLNDAVNRCLHTIKTDIESGFDLIHVDVSRVSQDMQESVATKLFDYALSLNPDIMFEFGSEDNTNTGIDESIANLDKQLMFVQKYKNNLKFFVTQTGSLTKHTQVGTFDPSVNKVTSEKIHSYGLMFKEHNADYLLESDLSYRKKANVDAVNIAPQLGSIQSTVLYQLKDHCSVEFTDFFNLVINSDYWKRWMLSESGSDNFTKFRVAAHYCYNHSEGKKLIDILNETEEFKNNLRTEIFSLLSIYKKGLKSSYEDEREQRLKARLEELRKRDPFIYR
jgi:hypothetical protein